MLALSCGGFKQTDSMGSDSYTTMTWEAQPGERTECDGSWDDSWMDRDDEDYSDAALNAEDLIDCTILIDGDDNPLLFESDDAPED